MKTILELELHANNVDHNCTLSIYEQWSRHSSSICIS